MFSTDTVLTGKRIQFFIKKFWWFLTIVLVLACVVLGLGIKSNKQQRDTTVTYESTSTFFLEAKDENYSITNILGDMKVFLRTEEYKNGVNEYLTGKGFEKIESTEGITFEQLETSNCFAIKIRENDKSKTEAIAQYTVQFMNEKTGQLYPETKFKAVEETINALTAENTGTIIQLKDILAFCIIIIAGCGIIYLIMIFDRRIISPAEACNYFSTKKCLIADDLQDMVSKLNLFDTQNKICLILPSKLDRSIKQNLSALKQVEIVGSDEISVEKIIDKKEWLLLHENLKIDDNYNKLATINFLNDQKVEGIIFLNHFQE